LGETPRIIELLGVADVVALPSEVAYAKMDYPLVLLEAMALAKPVVASDIAGIRAVTGSDGAMLVPVGDEEAVGSAIGRLLSDEQLRIELGTEARRIVEERFTLERMLTGVLNEIRTVVGT
jgi:phosphatidylinositol alpha-1,6-mannosyltransferase